LNVHEISQSLHSIEMTADVVCEGFRSDTNYLSWRDFLLRTE